MQRMLEVGRNTSSLVMPLQNFNKQSEEMTQAKLRVVPLRKILDFIKETNLV